MSNDTNTALFERAGHLMPYLNAAEALDLNAHVEDLEAFVELLGSLERKYLAKEQKGLRTAYNAPEAQLDKFNTLIRSSMSQERKQEIHDDTVRDYELDREGEDNE